VHQRDVTQRNRAAPGPAAGFSPCLPQLPQAPVFALQTTGPGQYPEPLKASQRDIFLQEFQANTELSEA